MPPLPQKRIWPVDGEPFRYWAESDSGENPYLVDLASYHGNGECGCMDFETRMRGVLEGREEMEPGLRDRLRKNDPRRCKHILRCREWQLDHDIAEANRREAQAEARANNVRHYVLYPPGHSTQEREPHNQPEHDHEQRSVRK